MKTNILGENPGMIASDDLPPHLRGHLRILVRQTKTTVRQTRVAYPDESRDQIIARGRLPFLDDLDELPAGWKEAIERAAEEAFAEPEIDEDALADQLRFFDLGTEWMVETRGLRPSRAVQEPNHYHNRIY